MPGSFMAISDAGVAVLRKREGCELEAYYDTAEPPVLTIGVGHTAAAGPPIPVEGMCITQEEADEIFDTDLDDYEEAVREAITVPMTQNQYDAFVSICFNIGQNGFAGSTFVSRFNAAAPPEEVAEAIKMWNKPPSIIPRRNGEVAQFLGGYVARIEEMEI